MQRSIFAVAAAALLLAAHASAYEVPYPELRATAHDYLSTCCEAKDVAGMEKKLKGQVETKAADQGIDEDRAMREIMLDWAAGNEAKIRRKDPKAVRQACFFFVKFIDKGFQMPWQIRDSFNEENVKTILDYLRGEIQKKRVGGAAPAAEEKKDEKKKEEQQDRKKK